MTTSGYTIRWKFHDMVTDDVVIFMLNPNAMDTPTTPRSLQVGFSGDGVRGIDLGPSSATSWSFTGVFLSQAQYDMLLEWVKRDSILRVTDHLGRVFEIITEKIESTERRPTAIHPRRGEYTISCLLLGEVA